MLIRFVVNNLFSFGKQREFNMLPRPRLKRLNEHKYKLHDLELLKLSSIYGANGAGKSNLIRAIGLLQEIVLDKISLIKISEWKFKFQDMNIPQFLAVEFIENDVPFYFGLEISNGNITTEELYISGLNKVEDKLIFERKTNINGKSSIRFSEEFDNNQKIKVIKSVLLDEFVKPNKSILKLLANRDNKFFNTIKTAFNWFEDSLNIIYPEAKPNALAHFFEVDKSFKYYAENLLCSFNVGIKSILSEKEKLKEFFIGEQESFLEELIQDVNDAPGHIVGLVNKYGDEIVVVKENDDIFVKRLTFEHQGKNDIKKKFYLYEESDGTIRLLDFIPAFQDIINSQKVYLVDEIERSIHPLLIKELIKRFADYDESKGQLIFTTHESNLLDQEIFRQDEIWFTEKDMFGISDIYSLSDFKEHSTTDIRKGYLNGRYGSIPFLGNLQDLNWHNYATQE